MNEMFSNSIYILLIVSVSKVSGTVLNSEQLMSVNSVVNNKGIIKEFNYSKKSAYGCEYSELENRDVANESYLEQDNETFLEESRKHKKESSFMERILPMMVIPFMVSTSMIPMMLISLKFMLLKSALIGKIAILLLLFNMFRSRSRQGGNSQYNSANAYEKDIAMEHYGYEGAGEYGAYVNSRKKKRKRAVRT